MSIVFSQAKYPDVFYYDYVRLCVSLLAGCTSLKVKFREFRWNFYIK